MQHIQWRPLLDLSKIPYLSVLQEFIKFLRKRMLKADLIFR